MSAKSPVNSVALIAFTQAGCLLAQRIARGLNAQTSVSGPARYADDLGISAYESLAAWTAERFPSTDALVYVGASGIAVRAIAPHVRDKFSDPAVVSVDEGGSFVVPLLSGHVGGANELARDVADIIGAQAAISTATDVNGLFAVDEWARRHGFALLERTLAKEVSAALLEGRDVGFRSDCGYDFGDDAPKGVVEGSADIGFLVSLDAGQNPFPKTLHLVPRVVTVGVGCRRGSETDVVRRAVLAALDTARIAPEAVVSMASIDVKQDEAALHELASGMGWGLKFYTAGELAAVPGAFASSDFVRKTVGVDNVCERAACAAGGKLVLGRQAGDGVTVALAASGCMASSEAQE